MAENGERARVLCEELGSPGQLLRVLYGLAYVYITRADPERTGEVLAALRGLEDVLGPGDGRVMVDSVRARAALYGGRFREACAVVEDGPLAEAVSAARPPALTGTDPVASAQWAYGLALWFTGHLARAERVMRDSVAAAQVGGPGFTATAALGHLALYAVLCRRPEEALALAEEAAAHATEHSFPQWEVLTAAFRAWALTQGGHIPEAIVLLEAAGRRADRMRMRRTRTSSARPGRGAPARRQPCRRAGRRGRGAGAGRGHLRSHELAGALAPERGAAAGGRGRGRRRRGMGGRRAEPGARGRGRPPGRVALPRAAGGDQPGARPAGARPRRRGAARSHGWSGRHLCVVRSRDRQPRSGRGAGAARRVRAAAPGAWGATATRPE